MPVLLDVESRSRADLSRVGGRRYWEHPSSEILVLVWYDTDTSQYGVWYPGYVWPHTGRVLVAHNAHGFDRFALERYGLSDASTEWIDSAQLARRAGLPGALDALGTHWCGVPKDKVASAFVKSLSSVRRPTGKNGAPRIEAATWRTLTKEQQRTYGVQPTLDATGLVRVLAYCHSDVEIMVRAWPRLQPWLSIDANAAALDRVINERGVCFDSALAARLLDEDAARAREAVARAAKVLGLSAAETAAAARSPKKFCAIVGTPDARAATLEHCDHPLADVRRTLATIASGKLRAGLARVHADGRLRDTLRYYGAHTGRWSGAGMQLQNLPQPSRALADVDVDVLAPEVLAGRPCTAEEIALLVRATITASPDNRLVVWDYSSVEARATAWAAEDHDALAVFRSEREPYVVAAATIYGIGYDDVTKAQRNVGKVAELACGFGGGPAAFERFATAYRLDLTGVDTRAIVTAWRELHAPITALWRACERGFRSALGGRARFAGPFEFVPSDTDDAVACFLPSGRPIVYHEPREAGRDLSYRGGRGREHVYGGKLVENAIQALCRDLLATALGAAEAAGLNPVLTVHDEIVCDVPASDADAASETLHKIMITRPSWAADFPLDATGWVGQRYRK